MTASGDEPAPALRSAYTVISVREITRTLAFHRDALGLPVRFVHGSGRYAELETGPVTSAFTQDDLAATGVPRLEGGFRPNRAETRAAGMGLAFATDRPDVVFDTALRAGATLVEPLVQKTWGQRVGDVRDPDGVLIEIGARVDQGRNDITD